MKNLVVLCCMVAGTLGFSPLLASQYSEMLNGLRERRYFDYALLYLDQLEAKPNLPDEVRQELPYERALVLMESSKTLRSPEKQAELLDQALSLLEQFSKDNPRHARAGDANSQRAEIVLGKARVSILQARLPANQSTRREFQVTARQQIAQARQVFETAQTQYEAALKKFGSFVDMDKDPEKYELRERTLMQLIGATLNLGLCRYEESQTYDSNAPEFKQLLSQAAKEFGQLHQRYRDYTGGLYARLYEGRCFDDQGDQQKAMGIYNELLDHDGSNPNVHKLQNVALQFKLEALNTKTPPDSEVVIDLAEKWLKANKAESRSQVGIAVQWEQAVAYEALGDLRDENKQTRERNLRTARTSAQFVNQFPGVYRDLSIAMIERIDGKLGQKERKPEDFESAFNLARQHFTTLQELRKERETAESQGQSDEDLRDLDQELQTEIHNAAELFQLAINLASPNDDLKSISTARLWLAYVHFWARRNYEAAILGEYVSKTAPREDSSLAIDAAFLSMAAYVQAYNETKGPAEQKQAELGFVIQACERLSTRWPDSDRANDARIMAGRIFSQANQPVEAAEWFDQIPKTDSHFAEAQLAAGQAFWKSYLGAARLPDPEKPSPEELLQWQDAARDHLQTGIEKLFASQSTDSVPSLELIMAKVSLAEILISLGEESQAIKLLTEEPQSVIQAMSVDEEAQRPASGLQSRPFASEVYKLLFRAYIGDGQLDEARTTMHTLETIAGGGLAGADLTELYVGLGKLLKEELDRYDAAGNQERSENLRSSFEKFLNDVYERPDGHSLGTLSWIGETYAALGESASGGKNADSNYRKSAQAYQEILKESQNNSSFATPEQLLAIKIRLAHSLRRMKDFSAAEQVLTELLRDKKDDLRLQIEAAELYRDWSQEPGSERKILVAISGNPENQVLGFGPLSNRMQKMLNGKKLSPEERATLTEHYYDARYQITKCRYDYAMKQSTASEKRRELDAAELEIVAFATVTKDITDEHRKRFNTLYRNVRTAMADAKRPVTDLEWAGDIANDPPDELANEEKPKLSPQHTKPSEIPAQLKPTNPILVYGLLGAGVAIGLVLITVVILRGNRRRRPLLKTQMPEELSIDFSSVRVPRSKGNVSIDSPENRNSAIISSTKKISASTAPKAVKPKPPPTS